MTQAIRDAKADVDTLLLYLSRRARLNGNPAGLLDDAAFYGKRAGLYIGADRSYWDARRSARAVFLAIPSLRTEV